MASILKVHGQIDLASTSQRPRQPPNPTTRPPHTHQPLLPPSGSLVPRWGSGGRPLNLFSDTTPSREPPLQNSFSRRHGQIESNLGHVRVDKGYRRGRTEPFLGKHRNFARQAGANGTGGEGDVTVASHHGPHRLCSPTMTVVPLRRRVVRTYQEIFQSSRTRFARGSRR